MRSLIDRLISLVSVIFVIFLLYYAYTLFVSKPRYSTLFILFILVIFLLNFIGDSKNTLFGVVKGKWLIGVGSLLIAISLFTMIYLALSYTDLSWRVGANTSTDYIVAFLILIPIVLTSWKAGGNILFLLILVSLFYIYCGWLFPGIFSHPGFSFKELLEIEILGMADGGLFSTVIQVVGTWVAIFIVYAGILSGFGAFDYILKGSFSIARRSIYLLPQVPIIASMFFGSISGAASANVAATGSFTIPLMKRYGIPRAIAGGIESVASTGGQVMPPVMGATAFLMAMILGKSYLEIMLHGFVPALLFYGTFAVAVFVATKEKIKPLTREIGKKADLWGEEYGFTKKDILGLLPTIVSLVVLLIALIYFLMDPLTAALYGIVALMITELLYKLVTVRKVRVFLDFAKNFHRGARSGAISTAQIGAITAGMALIIKALTVTALGPKISFAIVDISAGFVPLLLVLIWAICIIFGMAVSTLVVYLLVIVLVAPVLDTAGVAPLVSHFMIFYFAALAMITPPVAPASIVAAGIAGETFMKTAFQAVRLGAPLFILPFAFATFPEIIYLTHKTWSAILLVGVGLLSVSYALNSPKSEWVDVFVRVIAFIVGGFILFHPMVYPISRISAGIISVGLLILLGRGLIVQKLKTIKKK
jgi:TRAP transporter 4TM/12TM fusion protein